MNLSKKRHLTMVVKLLDIKYQTILRWKIGVNQTIKSVDLSKSTKKVGKNYWNLIIDYSKFIVLEF